MGGGQWPDGVAGAGGQRGGGGGPDCGVGTSTGGGAPGGSGPPRPPLANCLPHPPQVHCISTEFTPRKHGGEKGVPFRVQIDTFKQSENGEYTEHLHSASCQIKVFKVGRPPAPRPPPPQPRSGGRDPRAQRRVQRPGAGAPAPALSPSQAAGLSSAWPEWWDGHSCRFQVSSQAR